MKKWKWLMLLTVSSMLLGGCAMGGASGTKTTQGIAALDDGNYAQAQQLFEEAVQEDEEQMLAWRGLGLADMGLAQYEEAETAFQNALDAADEKMPENMKRRSIPARGSWTHRKKEWPMHIICAAQRSCMRGIRKMPKQTLTAQ